MKDLGVLQRLLATAEAQAVRRCSRTPMKTLALLLLFCLMTACSPMRPAQSTFEISGTQAERVAAVSPLISKRAPLPSRILDAQFIEEQTGDG
jgi:hypothetical protein